MLCITIASASARLESALLSLACIWKKGYIKISCRLLYCDIGLPRLLLFSADSISKLDSAQAACLILVQDSMLFWPGIGLLVFNSPESIFLTFIFKPQIFILCERPRRCS